MHSVTLVSTAMIRMIVVRVLRIIVMVMTIITIKPVALTNEGKN